MINLKKSVYGNLPQTESNLRQFNKVLEVRYHRLINDLYDQYTEKIHAFEDLAIEL